MNAKRLYLLIGVLFICAHVWAQGEIAASADDSSEQVDEAADQAGADEAVDTTIAEAPSAGGATETAQETTKETEAPVANEPIAAEPATSEKVAEEASANDVQANVSEENFEINSASNTASVETPAVAKSEEKTTEHVEPVQKPKIEKTVVEPKVADKLPEAKTQKDATVKPSAPVFVAKPVEVKKSPEAPKQEVPKNEQNLVPSGPILTKEQEDVIKTISDATTVKPKVLVAAPDINEKTEPSAQLQEETKQSTAAPLFVNDKQFVEEPARVQKGAVQELPTTLDTTSVDAGGNWLRKRAYWEKAEHTYEKMMEANSAIYELQLKFVKAHNEADDLSDKSFRELGLEAGQLSGLLERVLAEIQEQRERQGISEAERALVQTLKDRQQDVEQLKKYLADIEKLDNALDEAMLKLNQQVKSCREYEKRAWDNFKIIGRELNDKKAMLLFTEIDGFYKTVLKNRDYIGKQLWEFFDKTVGQIKQHFDEVASKAKTLKQKGLDLTKEFERFAQADREKQQQQSVGAHEKEEQARQAAEQAARKKPMTSWQKVQRNAYDVWEYIQDVMLVGWRYTQNLAERSWSWITGLFE